MIQHLQKAQRLPLAQVLSGTQLTLQTELAGMREVDLSVFGLDEQRKLSDERYFIFYNQTSSPEGAIRLDLNQQTFTLDLERMPLGIHRLLLAATSDDQTFADLGSGTSRVMDGQGGEVVFELTTGMFSTEQAVMLLELYRHQGAWRVAGVAQGFSGGLAALLQSFGGEVAEDAPPAGATVPAAPAVDWEATLSTLTTLFGQPAPTGPERA